MFTVYNWGIFNEDIVPMKSVNNLVFGNQHTLTNQPPNLKCSPLWLPLFTNTSFPFEYNMLAHMHRNIKQAILRDIYESWNYNFLSFFLEFNYWKRMNGEKTFGGHHCYYCVQSLKRIPCFVAHWVTGLSGPKVLKVFSGRKTTRINFWLDGHYRLYNTFNLHSFVSDK